MQNQSLTTDEEYDSPLLGSLRNANIASFIIHEACKKYYNTFQSKWIPLSFINYYFEEYKRYDFLSPDFLKPFFNLYKDIDTPSLVDNYYHCHYTSIIAKRNIKSQVHYLITKNYYLDCDLYETELLGMFDPDLYSDLGNVSKHLSNSDELITIKEGYEYYLLKKLVLDRDTKIEIKKAQKEVIKEATVNNSVLVGTQVEVPKQTGKVAKIFFPKLILPSPYPILTDKSRINSEHRVKRILRADRQINVISNYEFNGVKYKVEFIEKRKAAKKPPKRKFDFDF